MALALWAGHLSYGVYLFHMAALRAAEAWAPGWGLGGTRALAVVLTLAIAAAVYLAWENPWRLFGRRWAERLKG
jgi:peptidoglycan/LPS O-acetylase OafA/YrhL